jgi:hypothetical protein
VCVCTQQYTGWTCGGKTCVCVCTQQYTGWTCEGKTCVCDCTQQYTGWTCEGKTCVCLTVHSSTQDGHVGVRHMCMTVPSSKHDVHVGVRHVFDCTQQYTWWTSGNTMCVWLSPAVHIMDMCGLDIQCWRYQRGLSEVVNRRTDNTMAKRKGQKRINSDLQTLHRKLKIHQHKPHKNENELVYLESVLYINLGISCSLVVEMWGFVHSSHLPLSSSTIFLSGMTFYKTWNILSRILWMVSIH